MEELPGPVLVVIIRLLAPHLNIPSLAGSKLHSAGRQVGRQLRLVQAEQLLQVNEALLRVSASLAIAGAGVSRCHHLVAVTS